MTDYYNISCEETFKELKSSEKGLTNDEALKRQDIYGLNKLKEKKGITPFQILYRQFTSFIVIILIAATIISFLIGETLDAIVIIVIIILNGIFGFVQEYRAEKAIEELKKLTVLKSRVLRNGKEVELNSKELVPGDVIILEAGSKCPADARIFQASSLQVDESSLTGESVPSIKVTQTFAQDTVLADQENMVFMGTVVTNGSGRAVVTSTGMETEIGKIADLVQVEEEQLTPLQVKLKEFGKKLGIITIGVSVIIFIAGILKAYLFTGVVQPDYINEMFLTAVALAVAAIPEGLPAIVTISLALGVKRMVKRHAVIRQLPAVETLGSTNIICSDKTGTITQNQMTVREIYANNTLIQVTGEGYEPDGTFLKKGEELESPDNIELILMAGALCNDAKLVRNEKWEIIGDPTEGALLVSAEKAGLIKDDLNSKYPRIDELPFDSERKLMTTIHQVNQKKVAYVKGAPDFLVDKCEYFYLDGDIKKLTKDDKNKIMDYNTRMANEGLRVLGFAFKSLGDNYNLNVDSVESGLIFIGLQAMIDPPREGVEAAIKRTKTAGIRTVIISGDHVLTAKAIAQKIGLFKVDDKAVSGEDLKNITEQELDDMVDHVTVYARVSPEDKVRILNALKKKGNIVAMTGDGVNDAPALKQADIGISMGITGTDVAKEASDMILTDDNFTSIVNAVEQGRGIYSNIKKFVQYTLSSNLGEILVIFLAILIGWPLPLTAIQILWVNLLTDGLPGLALGLDPFSKNLMENPPRPREESIISRNVIKNIALVGLIIGAGTLLMFNFYGHESLKAQTVAFTTLVMFQLFNVLTYRAQNFKINISNSKYLVAAVSVSVLLQFAVLYTPLNRAFGTTPLGLMDWLVIIAASFTIYLILESRKMIMKHRKNKRVSIK
ncbi:MAG: calcium-translocating P-type ATPase, SERCA-type [Methanomicrobiales archaeon]